MRFHAGGLYGCHLSTWIACINMNNKSTVMSNPNCLYRTESCFSMRTDWLAIMDDNGAFLASPDLALQLICNGEHVTQKGRTTTFSNAST